MKKTFLTILITVAALVAVGCDQNDDYVVVEEIVYIDEDVAPPVPQGVYSITGDEEVLLYWLPVDDVNNDFDTYVVYRSDSHPDTGYWEIGRTTGEYFIDRNVDNGYTYYYAVSSEDVDGNLSDLSYEDVFDTPRPEGVNRSIFDFNVMPDYAGWDLSSASVVSYLSGLCDFYLEYHSGDGVFYFNVSTFDVDVQDMGYTESLDDIGYAPEFGWSQNGWCEVILNHTYVFWTADNNFAKVRVTSISPDQILFDWAYQVDPGNRELKPKVERNLDYLRYPQETI